MVEKLREKKNKTKRTPDIEKEEEEEVKATQIRIERSIK